MDPPIQTEYFLSGGATILTYPHLTMSSHGPDMRRGPTNLHARWGKSGELLLHSVGNTGEHGGTTRQDDVSVQVTTDIEITLVDRVIGRLMDTVGLKTEHGGLEEGLGSTESGGSVGEWGGAGEGDDKPLVANGDDLAVGKLVSLLEGRRVGGGLELLFEIKGDVTKFLLNVPNDFTFSGGVEGVAALSQILDQVLGKVSSGKIETEDGVGESETFVDGDSVGDTVTRVQDDTGGTTRGIEGQDGLNSDVESGSVEGLEHDLGHLFAVGLGIEGGLSEQDGMFLGSNTEFVVESMMPDFLHVIPVGDDTVLDGVLECEYTTFRLSLVTKWEWSSMGV